MAKVRPRRLLTLFAMLVVSGLLPAAASGALSQNNRAERLGTLWVAIGDSITVGLGATQPEFSFVGRTGDELNVEIDNQAVGGSRIAEQLEVMRGYSGQAANVLWLVGYNDMRAGTTLEAFSAALSDGLALLALRHSRVYLGLCLRMTSVGYTLYGPQWNHGSDNAAAAINQRMRLIAAQYPTVVLVEMDRYEPADDVSEDLVHPSDLGHLQIALDFLDQIVRQVQLPVIYVRARSESS